MTGGEGGATDRKGLVELLKKLSPVVISLGLIYVMSAIFERLKDRHSPVGERDIGREGILKE